VALVQVVAGLEGLAELEVVEALAKAVEALAKAVEGFGTEEVAESSSEAVVACQIPG